MKQIVYIISLYFMCISCSDFLDYKDNDKVIPDELDQYSELVLGELIQQSMGASCYNLWIMSDDFGTFVPSWIGDRTVDTRESYQNWYGWAKESQITPKGDEKIDPAWEHFYHKVLMCNIIEADVNEFADDAEGVKHRLLGEVQALRAMSYWYLLNMYGEPYRGEEQARTAMGVPINKETSIKDELYERATLREVYGLIEENLKSALQHLEQGEQKNTIFRPNKDVVRLFLSRIYLEQKRYDDVITVCNDALKETMRTIIPVSEMLTYQDSQKPMLNKDNNSMIFSWFNRDGYPGSSVSDYSSGRYCPAEDLVALFVSNDIRKYPNVSWDGNKHNIRKYGASTSGCGDMNYRVEEIYFNRAEAYIEKGEWKLGMKDINEVYSKRLEDGSGHLEATNVDDARTYLRNEKRKEFCFEDIRWFDIRRWGLVIEHKFYNFSMDGTYFTYILEAESPNYVLPLPLDIQRRNYKIEQPKRVEIQTK